jgi:hypothetical protein
LVRFTFSPASFAEILREMALQFGVPMEDTSLRFPPVIGEGYLKSIDLPNGLDALVGDFTLQQGMLIERSNVNQEYYVFVCEIAKGVSRFYVDIDQHRVETMNQEVSAMYLLSFLSDFSQYASAGTQMQTVRVIITRDWLAKYLKIDVLDEVLQRYLSLKAGSIHVKDIDFESMTFMEEILHPPAEIPMEKAYIQNRIMMLIENSASPGRKLNR